MRVVFFGQVRYSAVLLARLCQLPDVELVGVVTRRTAPLHADFCSLIPFTERLGIPVLAADDVPEDEWVPWLRALRPDVAYAMGWSTILKRSVIEVFPLGIIGYHPALLPRNRGHHPLIWALALGLEETASTLFFLDEGIDTGDIVSQRRVRIRPEDDAGTLYETLTLVACEQIEQVTAELAHGRLQRTPQDHSRSSVWRRRGCADGRIDWRMSANTIHNLVRALTRPYVGAHCVVDGRDVKIWRTCLAPASDAWRDLEPGRVVGSIAGRFVVKCGEGLLEVVDHDLACPPRVGACLR